MPGLQQRIGRVPLLFASLVIAFLGSVGALRTEAAIPVATYIFPSGAQRGTTIDARIGGLYFHGRANFHIENPEIIAPTEINEQKTVYFESPLIFRPESQRPEDYPKDHGVRLTVPANAHPGISSWHCTTDQGSTKDQKFIIGNLPELTEDEIEGQAIPQLVEIPITINGRIFPREDIDIWTFEAERGQAITCQVISQQLGYPLESVLSIHTPTGEILPTAQSLQRGDPTLSFVAPHDGRYAVHIADANYSGLQNYVYRLTLHTGHRVVEAFPLGGHPGENIELTLTTHDGKTTRQDYVLPKTTGLTEVPGHPTPIPFQIVPADRLVFQGRINQPGKQDRWTMEAQEGATLELRVHAHTLHSRLDSWLRVYDADGKRLGENDDQSKDNPDSRLVIQATKSGPLTIQVEDKFASRGGLNFGYLLEVAQRTTGYEIAASSDPVIAGRIFTAEFNSEKPPASASLPISVTRYGTTHPPITLRVEGLPNGVSVQGTEIDAKSSGTTLQFHTQPDTPFAHTAIRITATADYPDGQTLTRQLPQPIRFSVVPKPPFKHTGYYRITNNQPAGAVLLRDYQLERLDGFEGPVRISLADSSVRHLQGVHGPVITVPAGATEFVYPTHFGTTMDMNRTCRMQLMLVGEVEGRTVSYTTPNVNDQVIAVTSEGLLNVSATHATIGVTANQKRTIAVKVGRNIALRGCLVTVTARIPRHFEGVTVNECVIDGSSQSGTLALELASSAKGPFNMALPLVAKAIDQTGHPHQAETQIELVWQD